MESDSGELVAGGGARAAGVALAQESAEGGWGVGVGGAGSGAGRPALKFWLPIQSELEQAAESLPASASSATWR